ncbi:MAG: hypothetical protein IJ087_21305 [Eggerthellaceae bacterium]|nr:hypothetical protein [Eggerthellaceae bacterium]
MDESVSIAMKMLHIDEDTARRNSRPVNEIGGFYFWQPGRGGSSLLIGGDGGVLAATSAVSFEKHLAAFLDGRRSDDRA